jgi:DNA-binding NarL/FixJ family response regulator
MSAPRNAGPVRVVLGDDHAMVRSAVKALLTAIEGVEVIGEAADGRELIELVDRLTPDLVMSDITMPGMDGIAATAEIRARHPAIPVLMLSMQTTAEVVKQAVASGACGYVMKDAPAFELEHAIRSVMENGRYFSPAITGLLLQPPETAIEDDLTARQIQIVKLLVRGMGSHEVGRELGLSPKTVDVHRGRIMDRLGFRDLASLTLYAVRKNLIEP